MLKKVMPIVLAGSLMWASFASATEVQNNSKASEVDGFQRIHEIVVSKQLGEVNGEGQLVINTSAEELNVTEEDYKHYVDDIDSLNYAAKEGVVLFDDNLEFDVRTPEEFEEFLDSEEVEPNSNIIFVPFNDPGAPPAKSAIGIARGNKTALKNLYETTLQAYILSGLPNPGTAAVSVTTLKFVNNVKPGGSQDYKVVPGWGPWSAEYTFTFDNNVKEVQNASYLGNYNYGFVGRYLFSLNILLLGGDGVSIITGKTPDGEEDKRPIRRGFAESANY